ncbi:MAG: hypothetical protein M1827_006943 [Pycnora praestabilis]|nr:MAG: hypothetical protein M1827_006943 [Pycnora praestabilis]
MSQAPSQYMWPSPAGDGTMIISTVPPGALLPPPQPPPASSLPPMEPGKIYVEKPPGRTKPVFVRKKPEKIRIGLGFMAEALSGSSKPRSKPEKKEEPLPPQPQYALMQAPPQLQLTYPGPQPGSAPEEQPPQTFTRLTPSLVPSEPKPSPPPPPQLSKSDLPEKKPTPPQSVPQHICWSCGKHRSPHYHQRHPIAPGEVPRMTICRKCKRQRTPSPERNANEQQEESKRKPSPKEETPQKRIMDRIRILISDSAEPYGERRNSLQAEMRIVRRRGRIRPEEHEIPRYITRERSRSRSPPRVREQRRSGSNRRLARVKVRQRSEPESETNESSQGEDPIIRWSRIRTRSPEMRDRSLSREKSRSDSRSSSRSTEFRSSKYWEFSRPAEPPEIRYTVKPSRPITRLPELVPRSILKDSSRSRSRSRSGISTRPATYIVRRPIRRLSDDADYVQDTMEDDSRHREFERRIISTPQAYRHQYIDDYDVDKDSEDRQTRTPSRPRAGSASGDYAGTPYPSRTIPKKKSFDRPRGTYSGHIHQDRPLFADVDYDPPIVSKGGKSTLARSPSEGVIYVDGALHRESWDSDSANVGGPRVLFGSEAPQRRNSISDRLSEVVRRSRRRQRLRVADMDGATSRSVSYEYTPCERYGPPRNIQPLRVAPPSPPPFQRTAQSRYLTSVPCNEEIEISNLLKDARLTSPPSSISPRSEKSSRRSSFSQDRGPPAQTVRYVPKARIRYESDKEPRYDFIKVEEEVDLPHGITTRDSSRSRSGRGQAPRQPSRQSLRERRWDR